MAARDLPPPPAWADFFSKGQYRFFLEWVERYWKDSGRVSYTHVSDREALDAFTLLTRLEGIIPALESAHAVAHAAKLAAALTPQDVVLVNLSGRGDKDLDEVLRLLDEGD